MFVVDTNVLIHAVNSDSPRYAQARAALESWLKGPLVIHLTWGIAYEFLRVATHPSVFPHPLTFREAVSFLGVLFRNPHVQVLTEKAGHFDLLEGSVRALPSVAGNVFHDLHTALLMREHGLSEVRTEDADFRRFPGVKSVNPF